MKNFERLASGVDVEPLLSAVRGSPLWDEITARQDHPDSPHHDTRAIFLRWAESRTVEAVFNELQPIDYPAAFQLPAAGPLVQLAYREAGACGLGRVMLASLAPGGAIDPHADEGAYAEFYTRYHIPLQSDPGNTFAVEGETVHMVPGELWWFNHRKEHKVVNASERERIHLIIDLKLPEKRTLTFKRESALDLWPEIMPLLEAHWQEIAHYPDIPLDPDKDAYNAVEASGQLRCYTVRVGDVLAGYAVFFVRQNIHYKGCLQATQDVLFVHPRYRETRAGLGLIRYCERALRKEGVQVIYHHVKRNHDQLGTILERMDYELVDLIYARRLN